MKESIEDVLPAIPQRTGIAHAFEETCNGAPLDKFEMLYVMAFILEWARQTRTIPSELEEVSVAKTENTDEPSSSTRGQDKQKHRAADSDRLHTDTNSTPTAAYSCSDSTNPYHYSSKLIQHQYSSSSSACTLDGVWSANCKHWRTMFVVLLANSSRSESDLSDIKNFINGVTQYCDSTSTLQLFAQGLTSYNFECPMTRYDSSMSRSLMDKLTLEATVVPDDRFPGEVLAALLEQVYICTVNNQLASGEAGVVYVLTNVDCDELCETEDLRQNTGPVTQLLILLGFIVQYMFLETDVTKIGKIPLMKVNPHLNFVNDHSGTYEAAVKRLPCHAVEQNRVDFFHEINFMKNLGYHTHVIRQVRAIGVISEETYMLGCVSCTVSPMILVEYCEHGDLLHFVRKQRGRLLTHDNEDTSDASVDICVRIKDLVSIAWQVSDGLTYLSSKNFIHRDVAARNVLLTKHLVAKVSDFGLGRYADSALYTARGGRLPFKSMSLEALKYYEFSEKSDVWAFAILLFEMFSFGDVPYAAIQPADMISHVEQGNRPEQPERCPDEIFALMAKCWRSEPKDRPTFSEVSRSMLDVIHLACHMSYLAASL
ncbi:unnamed protein product [Nippostrongylus brasiliensis]|uniref:Putative tyrosine-protein kinase (inferred by orthology to a C. elegans protein) n=1 Tax=Nippostrongylus brasiliensis TaxID=27835 RepID=A0A158QZ75_NIPBR|nr:unnamed protein product [Nippostrongylus brasiliensis]